MPIHLQKPTREDQIIRNLFLPITWTRQTAATADKIFEHGVAVDEEEAALCRHHLHVLIGLCTWRGPTADMPKKHQEIFRLRGSW